MMKLLLLLALLLAPLLANYPTYKTTLPNFFKKNSIQKISKKKSVFDYTNYIYQRDYLNIGNNIDVFLKKNFIKGIANPSIQQLLYLYNSAYNLYGVVSNPWNYYFIPHGYRLNLSYNFDGDVELFLYYSIDY